MVISNTKESGFNFLILINFSENSYKALDYLIKLVKTVGGKIEIYCIINPSDMEVSDNQIAALRSIQTEKKRIERKLISIVEMIELEGIKTCSSYSIGNIKSELKQKLIHAKPDVVVIGKGEGFTNWMLNYLINEYKESVLILGSESNFLKGTKITIGYNTDTLDKYNFQLISKFCQLSETPLTLLKVVNPLEKNNYLKTTNIPSVSDQSDLFFRFEYKNSSNVANALLEDASSCKVELLSIGRSKYRNPIFQRFFNNSTTLKIAKDIKIPLLIMSKKEITSMNKV
jgi:hypothetical protein